MTKQERKVIFTGAGIVILALLVILVLNGINKKEKEPKVGAINDTVEQNTQKYVMNLESGTKINNSNEFNKSKKYKEIEISNIQFTYENGKTVLLANVKNTGSTKHKKEIVKLIVLGENNEVVDETKPVMPELEPGETKKFSATISGENSVNAKDFRIEEKK